MTASRSRRPPPASLNWGYFLDVDGTLVNIADTPQGVEVDSALLDLIETLHRASGGAVALISGRMISDLHNHLRLPNIALAGLHGLERRDSTGRLWIHAAPPDSKQAMKQALAPILTNHPDLLLEDKGLTLALHYRMAPHLASFVHTTMRRLLDSLGLGLELQFGKRVVEIKPAGIDKGTAVAEYLTESPFKGRRAVFIGDDLNDEHGFAEVNKVDGISIKVGKGSSCARFRLPDVAAVRHWLAQSLQERL